jgi:hypothetical protein
LRIGCLHTLPAMLVGNFTKRTIYHVQAQKSDM